MTRAGYRKNQGVGGGKAKPESQAQLLSFL